MKSHTSAIDWPGVLREGITLFFLFAITAAAQPGGSQPPAVESAPASTFHAATKLVQLDVVARSKGAPAAGLTKDDFTLLDNGKPQKIAFFSVRSTRTAGAPAVPLPQGAVSNRFARDGEMSANSTIVLIDQKNTPHTVQAIAIPRIAKFIDSRHKGDRVGIYTLLGDGSLDVVQELTDNPELLARAAKALKPEDPNRRTADVDGRVDRVMATRRALEDIGRHLTRLPGRKSLVWITTAFPLLGHGFDFRPDMEKAARALNDANVALYAVDARGLTGSLASGMTGVSSADSKGPRTRPGGIRMPRVGGGFPSGTDTMDYLAGLTGGLVFINDNGIENLIQAAIDDGELTYTLGFYPLQDEQDGTWHKLKVEVARREIKVRYRENYFAAGETARALDRPTLEQLLRDPLDATQLEIVAETAPDPARPGFIQVKVTVDLHDLELEHENDRRSGIIDVSVYVEGSGKVLTKTLKIDMADDQFAAFLGKGIDTVESVDVTGGLGALRVVVQDRTTGAAGTVTVPLGQK
jgi:VWFA-related protein